MCPIYDISNAKTFASITINIVINQIKFRLPYGKLQNDML